MTVWSAATAVSAGPMRSKKTRFAIFDTSVYVENFRTGRFTAQILGPTFIPRCSSVVLHELRRGARTPAELKFVGDLLRNCPVLSPTSQHWIEAAEVLASIRRREHYEANKIRELAFDILIALSARSIGATVVTCNQSDFETIRRYLTFQVLYWEQRA